MATFMVERYLPGVSAGQAAAAELLAKQVALHLRAQSGTVHHLRSLFVPQDEQCFVLFQATSAHALAETIQRVGIAYERITEVIDLTAEDLAGSGRADSVNRHPC
jgi:Protein of unknown function (DUF4242)